MQLNDANVTIEGSDGKWKATHHDTLAEFEGDSFFGVVADLDEHLATLPDE